VATRPRPAPTAGGGRAGIEGILHGHDGGLDTAATKEAERLGWELGGTPATEGQVGPPVGLIKHEGCEGLARDPGRIHTMTGEPVAVVDTGARLRAENRNMIGGHVDRARPSVGEFYCRQLRQESPGLVDEVLHGGPVPHRAILATGEADGSCTGPDGDAAIGRRPEVVQEHPRITEAFATEPPQFVDQLRHGLGEDNVATEVRDVGTAEWIAGKRGTRREHDVATRHGSEAGADLQARLRLDRLDVGSFVQTNARGEDGPT